MLMILHRFVAGYKSNWVVVWRVVLLVLDSVVFSQSADDGFSHGLHPRSDRFRLWVGLRFGGAFLSLTGQC